jgi:hypothetical protein
MLHQNSVFHGVLKHVPWGRSLSLWMSTMPISTSAN